MRPMGYTRGSQILWYRIPVKYIFATPSLCRPAYRVVLHITAGPYDAVRRQEEPK
jgi:hypothetical protein